VGAGIETEEEGKEVTLRTPYQKRAFVGLRNTRYGVFLPAKIKASRFRDSNKLQIDGR